MSDNTPFLYAYAIRFGEDRGDSARRGAARRGTMPEQLRTLGCRDWN
jgi:hypothetical protein